MTVAYEVAEPIPFPEFTIRVDDRYERREPNYWCTEFVTPDQFEHASHHLVALDGDYNHGLSEQCHDICKADVACWTLPERAWDWLPRLQADGCRIAHDVRVEKGVKQFKLVYAAPIMDLFDSESSQRIIDEVYGLDNVVWNDATISWVRRHAFHGWDGPLPLMFQVLYHNREGATYRGSTFGLSGKTFVSQEFKDEYKRRSLTGLEFFEIPRTTPAMREPRIL